MDKHRKEKKSISLSSDERRAIMTALKRVLCLWPGGPWKPPTFWKRKTT